MPFITLDVHYGKSHLNLPLQRLYVVDDFVQHQRRAWYLFKMTPQIKHNLQILPLTKLLSKGEPSVENFDIN